MDRHSKSFAEQEEDHVLFLKLVAEFGNDTCLTAINAQGKTTFDLALEAKQKIVALALPDEVVVAAVRFGMQGVVEGMSGKKSILED